MEQKGLAEQLFGKQAPFPDLPVGKASDKDKAESPGVSAQQVPI